MDSKTPSTTKRHFREGGNLLTLTIFSHGKVFPLSTLTLLHFPFLSVCNIKKIVVWLRHETENDLHLWRKNLIAMKKSSFAFLILSLIATNAIAQKTDWERHGLKGRVKSDISITFLNTNMMKWEIASQRRIILMANYAG